MESFTIKLHWYGWNYKIQEYSKKNQKEIFYPFLLSHESDLPIPNPPVNLKIHSEKENNADKD